MDGLEVGNPQAFFLCDGISGDRTPPDPEKKHTLSDPFQRDTAPYSSRSFFSTTVNSSDIHHHVCPVRDFVRECHRFVGDAELP